MLRKPHLLLIFAVFISFIVSAQDSSPYSGVFALEQDPQVLIILKRTDSLFTGMVGTATGHQEIGGRALDAALELHLIGGDDQSINYVYANEKDKLQVIDASFNSVFFLRTNYSVDSILYSWRLVPSLPMKSEKTDSSNAGNTYSDRKFMHLYTGNGYSEKWAFYLYANGTFRYKGDASYTSSDFSGVTAGDDHGTWTVQSVNGKDYLLLDWSSGVKKQLTIEKANDSYLLNGTKYFLVGLTEYE